VFSLTDVVLMNLAGMRSTAVLIPDPLLSPSELVDSASLVADTIPSMQYGSLNPSQNDVSALLMMTETICFHLTVQCKTA